MKRVVTFSLWGDIPRYTIGAIENIKLVNKYYPDFEVYLYVHVPTVPEHIIKEAKTYSYVKIISKTGDLTKCKPMMWRFEAIDDLDVEIMMPRDTDTRILEREQLAVRDWLNSDKLFHIMRDHPKHSAKIFGGMFGTKKNPNILSWKKEIDKIIQRGARNYDTFFLENYIYPKIVASVLIHTSFKVFTDEDVNPFPTRYDKELRFVGEYVYEDESRCEKSIKILRKNMNKVISI